MKLLAAIKHEERELEKRLHKIQNQLNGVRAAARELGYSTNRELKTIKKRGLSAAARAKISRAQRKRWAKVKAKRA